jgi:hypothetical protein
LLTLGRHLLNPAHNVHPFDDAAKGSNQAAIPLWLFL